MRTHGSGTGIPLIKMGDGSGHQLNPEESEFDECTWKLLREYKWIRIGPTLLCAKRQDVHQLPRRQVVVKMGKCIALAVYGEWG